MEQYKPNTIEMDSVAEQEEDLAVDPVMNEKDELAVNSANEEDAEMLLDSNDQVSGDEDSNEDSNEDSSEDSSEEISEESSEDSSEEINEESNEESKEESNEELSEEEKKYIEKVIEDTCQMKADELILMGIRATGKQVWLCVSSKYKKGYPEFHQVVNDVLSLKSTKFMNWLLVESRKENGLTFHF